jgi:hypothetical protein
MSLGGKQGIPCSARRAKPPRGSTSARRQLEESRRGEYGRRAMQRHSEAEDKQTSVEGVTRSCVDARASKRRTVIRSGQRSKRPSQGDPAQDQHSRAGCFEDEAEQSEPGLNVRRPTRADNCASDYRKQDDRLQDDPAFTASSQRRRVHGMMLGPLRRGCRRRSGVRARRPCAPRGRMWRSVSIQPGGLFSPPRSRPARSRSESFFGTAPQVPHRGIKTPANRPRPSPGLASGPSGVALRVNKYPTHGPGVESRRLG